jgi:hypothetical protein
MLSFVVACGWTAAGRADVDAESRAIERFHRQQYQELLASTEKNRTAANPAQVVLGWTEALYRDVCSLREVASLPEFEQRLEALRAATKQEAGSEQFFLKVCAVRREIALANPLLDFDSLVFTSHLGLGRYLPLYKRGNYGREGVPDHRSGLYQVTGLKSGRPEFRDLLEGAVVRDGRYRGLTLSNKDPRWGGRAVFNSLDLSYDGRRVLFPWGESGTSLHYTEGTWGHKRPDYNRGGSLSFHLFCLDLDARTVSQLTDGHFYDDFHAVWMPDDRVVFCSNRLRHQYRHSCKCDLSSLFSMRADGSDLYPISWHEASELCPSVDHDGRLIYSRWDHFEGMPDNRLQLWTSYPDGRDPRAPFGNYGAGPAGVEPPPTFSCKAIPGAPGKYVAVTAFPVGPLLVVDLSRRDGAPGNWRPFRQPEASGRFPNDFLQRGQHYCEPWPLSENYCLAARGSQVLLTDSWGNEILLFDAEGLLGDDLIVRFPTPLRPRQRPPVIPTGTWQGQHRREAPKATIAVTNVFDSDFEWPAGTKITALRVIQYPPKTWPVSGGQDLPCIGLGPQSMVRVVLGTVPVEPDGSVYFEAPVEGLIHFQALNEKGLAVQTMRSATYVHPGEQMVCAGCHEEKWRATAPLSARTPLALRRAPSAIVQESGGSGPLCYLRSVQPVFDARCASCHQKEGAIETTAYTSMHLTRYKEGPEPNAQGVTPGPLAPYVFYYGKEKKEGKGPPQLRSVPGTFGALASPLLKYLDKRHYGVELTPEQYRRVTLWLDCNAVACGSYAGAPFDERAAGLWWPEHVDRLNPTAVQQEEPGTTERIGRSDDAAELIGLLDSPSWIYRQEAARALGRLKHLPAAERLERMALEDDRPAVRAEAFRALHALAQAGYNFAAFWDKTLTDCGFHAGFYDRKAFRWVQFSDAVAMLAGESWLRDTLLNAAKKNHETLTATSLLAGHWPDDERVTECMRRLLFETTAESAEAIRAANAHLKEELGEQRFEAQMGHMTSQERDRCSEMKKVAYGYVKVRLPEADYPAFLLDVVRRTTEPELALDALQQALVHAPPLQTIIDHVHQRCVAGDTALIDGVGELAANEYSPRLLERILKSTNDAAVRLRVFRSLGLVPTREAVQMAARCVADEASPEVAARAFFEGQHRALKPAKDMAGSKLLNGWNRLCRGTCSAEVCDGLQRVSKIAGEEHLLPSNLRYLQSLAGRQGGAGGARRAQTAEEVR